MRKMNRNMTYFVKDTFFVPLVFCMTFNKSFCHWNSSLFSLEPWPRSRTGDDFRLLLCSACSFVCIMRCTDIQKHSKTTCNTLGDQGPSLLALFLAKPCHKKRISRRQTQQALKFCSLRSKIPHASVGLHPAWRTRVEQSFYQGTRPLYFVR